MLIDEWMPAWDAAERHETRIRASRERVWQAGRTLDLGASPVIRALFALRSLPGLLSRRGRGQRALGNTMEGLLRNGFVLLGERPGEELLLGLAGRFWRPSGDILRLTPDEMRRFDRPGYALATWNFTLADDGDAVRLATETRVRWHRRGGAPQLPPLLDDHRPLQRPDPARDAAHPSPRLRDPLTRMDPLPPRPVTDAELAGDLLRLCAFLDAAHPLPVAALEAGAEVLPQPLREAVQDRAARERMFDALLDLGAGGAARGELVLRASAVAAAGERLDGDERRFWAGIAVRAMERAFPDDPTRREDLEAAGRLLPHAVAAARHALREETETRHAAQLLYLAGRFVLESQGDHLAARELLETAVAARRWTHGPDDPRVAMDLNYLNGALLHLGEWSPMAANAVRAAEILEHSYGARDRTVITHVNNAALLLARAGERGKARSWFLRALKLAEPVFGKAHPFCATILSNLGDLDRQEGDLRGAREAYRRALAIDEAAYGSRHDSTARDLAKLGEALADLGEPAAARGYLERSLSWVEEAHGPDDIRVTRLRAVLARLDGQQG